MHLSQYGVVMFPIIKDEFLSVEECNQVYSDAMNRKDELYHQYLFHDKTLQQCLESDDVISKCVVFASKYFDLSSMVGCEVWYNYSVPPDVVESHPWHTDKDEVLFRKNGKLEYPLCTIVYYPLIDSDLDGELVFKNYNVDQIKPKTNRILCFESHVEHKTNLSKSKRISISICPWDHKVERWYPDNIQNRGEKKQMELNKRECGGCTECCQGWLWGSAHGKNFWNGRPCHFVGERGCTIYKDRPHDPCVTFRCGWLDDTETFPEWMKPSLSKVIAQKLKTKNGIEFYKIYECGKTIDSTTLNYLILHALQNNVNMNIQVSGGWANYGTQQFLNDIN